MNGYNNQQFQQQPVYNPQTVQQKKKIPGFAITSLCCGIASIVLCCFNFIGVIFGICAVVSGIISMVRENPNGKGMAVSGLICGGVGLFFTVVVWFSSMAFTGCVSAGTSYVINEVINQVMDGFGL